MDNIVNPHLGKMSNNVVHPMQLNFIKNKTESPRNDVFAILWFLYVLAFINWMEVEDKVNKILLNKMDNILT
ncbi:hypothetical protein HanIR_Chr02g0052541 [Helianthus annuus]|nr:hypothetical protein HanIR_Chr02g0052541 [Helianthus annuus]